MNTCNSDEREIRTPLWGTFHYVSGCGEAGRATWLNVSRTGAGVQLGRYLRPGHVVQLQCDGDETTGTWPIPATVIWCRPIPDSVQFQAGLAIDRTCPETALRFATLGYAALAMNKSNLTTVTTAGWSASHAAPASALHKCLPSLTQAV